MRKLISVLVLLVGCLLASFAMADEAVGLAVSEDYLMGAFGVATTVLYGVAHMVTRLPASVTGSWPPWVRVLIDVIAANYGNAKNSKPSGGDG